MIETIAFFVVFYYNFCMKDPKLKFSFSLYNDFNVAWSFYNNPLHGGSDFWRKGAIQYHDDLINIENVKNKKEFLLEYISSLYIQHNKEFEHRKAEINVLYKQKELRFFHETNKIFNNHPWPRGEYVAYLSVFDFCPRFLDDKTFFVFMYDSDDGLKYTVFHEMLHFIFYDYCLKKYPKIFGMHSTEEGSFWELAELFNLVLQQTSAFVKLHGLIKGFGYSNLASKFPAAKRSWHGDIDNWITKFGSVYVRIK